MTTQIVRFKYRQTAVQPELAQEKSIDAFNNGRKKVKPKEEKLTLSDSALDFAVAAMFPEHTQNTKIVKTIYSDEAKIRRMRQPTIFEKIETQKKWLEQQEMEARRQLLHQKMVDTMYEKENNIASQTGNTEELDLAMTGGDDDVFGVLDTPDMEFDQHKLTTRQCMLEVIGMKERRFTRDRNTKIFHNRVKWSRRYKMALSLYFGIGGLANRTGATEITPWLLLGGHEIAGDLAYLISHGVTHVMNCTSEIKSAYGDMFICIQFPIKDISGENLGRFFPKALEFFERVEACRGKVYVHCDSGCSRAPVMVMGYLVAGRKKLTLLDAFDYVKTRRPQVLPNRDFLTQVAELELESGEGCSVLFHREWSYYEFNLIKASKPEFRESKGIYKTTLKMYMSLTEEDEAMEEAKHAQAKEHHVHHDD